MGNSRLLWQPNPQMDNPISAEDMVSDIFCQAGGEMGISASKTRPDRVEGLRGIALRTQHLERPAALSLVETGIRHPLPDCQSGAHFCYRQRSRGLCTSRLPICPTLLGLLEGKRAGPFFSLLIFRGRTPKHATCAVPPQIRHHNITKVSTCQNIDTSAISLLY